MRLYLSSFDIGEGAGELVKLAPEGRVGLVMNALDNRAEGRANWQADQTSKLEALGFAVRLLDLRDYFGRPWPLAEALAELDLVWVNGGNAFILRRAMQLSGFDVALKAALANDELVYAGFSAAAVVLPASLRGLDLIDDPHDVPDGYPAEVPWEGLNILPFAVVVHWNSDHPEAGGARKEVEFHRHNGTPFRTLRDGQALIIEHGKERVVPLT